MSNRQIAYIFSVTLLLFGAGIPAHAQIFGIRISQIYISAMPTWMYNGFTETQDGDPVQGSDVSPLRMTFGAGFELRLTDTMSVEPEGWLFMQEYIALKEYDKTVPTQIETGSAVGDIANTIGLAFSVPWVYTWRPEWSGKWEFDGRAGLALVYRIPIGGIDGTDAAPAAIYWIAGRFVYPQFGVAADYQFTERIQVGLGLDWYVPMYNIWDNDEPTPFLDETMLRWGARVRWTIGGSGDDS
ncbi:MAG: hypothetical protein PF508_12465 [Spirochaeta sp.]|nr:hypothetical protein [Spirochaeta sp.]